MTRDSKVPNFKIHVFIDEHILRFDVSMDDVAAVDVLNDQYKLEDPSRDQTFIEELAFLLHFLNKELQVLA